MKKKTTTRKRRIVRRFVIAVLFGLVLPALLLLVVVPMLARWGVFTPFVQAKVEETLGWKTQIGELELWPLSEFTARNVVLSGSESRISCRSIRVRFAPLDLLRTGRMESIEVTGLRALLAQDSNGNWEVPQVKSTAGEKPFDSSFCRRITLQDAGMIIKLAENAKPGETPSYKKFSLAGIEGEVTVLDAIPAVVQKPMAGCFAFLVLGFLVEDAGRKGEACRFAASGTIFDLEGNPSVETRVLAATADLERVLAALGVGDALAENELGGEARVDAEVLYRSAPPAGSSRLSLNVVLQGEKLCWQKRSTGRGVLQDGELFLAGKFYADFPTIDRLLGLDVEVGLGCRAEQTGERMEFKACLPQLEVFLGEAAQSAARPAAKPVAGHDATTADSTAATVTREPEVAMSAFRFVMAMEKLNSAGTPFDEAVSAFDNVKAIIDIGSSSAGETWIDCACLAAHLRSGAQIDGKFRLLLGKDTNIRARFETDGVEIAEILRLAGLDPTVARGRGTGRATVDGSANFTEDGSVVFDGTSAIDVGCEGKTRAELCLPLGGADLSVRPCGVLQVDAQGRLDGNTRDLCVFLDASARNSVVLGGSALIRPVALDGHRLSGFALARLPRKENMPANSQPGRDQRRTQPAGVRNDSSGMVWREVRVELARGLVPLLAAPRCSGSASSDFGTPALGAGSVSAAGNKDACPATSARTAIEKRMRARLREARIAALLKLAGAGLESVPVSGIQQVASVATGVEYMGGGFRRNTSGADGNMTVSGRAIGLSEATVENILAVRTIADGAAGLFTNAGGSSREMLKKGKTSLSFTATRRKTADFAGENSHASVKPRKEHSENWLFTGTLVPEMWTVSLGDEILAAEKVRGVLTVSGAVGMGNGDTETPMHFNLSGRLGFDALLADRFFLQEDQLGFVVNARYNMGANGGSSDKLVIASAKVETPSYGVCRAAGAVSWSRGAEAAPDLDLHLRLDNLIHERIFKDFLQDPYGETHTFLKEAAWTGTTKAGLHVYTTAGSGAGGSEDASAGAGGNSRGEEDTRESPGKGPRAASKTLRIDGEISSVGDLKLWDIQVSGYRLRTPVKLLSPLAAGGQASNEEAVSDPLAGKEEVKRSDVARLVAAERPESISPLERGWLHIARIESGPIVIPAVATRIAVAGNDIFCYDPISFDLFGGAVSVANLAITNLWGEPTSSARLRCEGRIADVDLGLLSSAYETRYGLEGTIAADFEEIEISSEHVLLRGRNSGARSGSATKEEGGMGAAGTGAHAPAVEDQAGVHMNLFGGKVLVTKLAVARPLSDMRGLALSLNFEGIALERVTRSFAGIGRMSGVLRGNLSNLEVVGGDLIGFEAWVETVPQPKTPQRISPEAIQNLRKLTSGIQGVVEDHIKRRDWPYLRMGFYAQLKGGKCLFRGRYFRHKPFLGFIPSVGKLPDEYILSGKIDKDVEEYFVITPIGGVNVVNGTPGNTVRYDDLVSTVKSVLEGRTKPRIK